MQKDFLNIEDINKQIKLDALKVIRDAESSFRSQLFELANFILSKDEVKIILIGGPSCAGKTTSANLLKDILQSKGKEVLAIQMDNFFKSQNERKVLLDGSIDFDSLDIVNLKQMRDCFKELFKYGYAKFPSFDFVNGINHPEQIEYRMTNDTIIIFEGIHVLNPKLISHLGTENFIKVYISNFSGFCLDDTQISTRKFRLVRRMVRDMAFRGVEPDETLKMWPNIVNAEQLYIQPYKNNVDWQINTTHSYEMGLYKNIILDAVKRGKLSFEQLPWLKLFESVESVDAQLLPETTLMHEFI